MMSKHPISPAPLPTRDGISPSYIWLPEGLWPDLISFLAQQFPDVGVDRWLRRIAAQEVRDGYGAILQANSPVRRGMCVFYYREIEQETPIPFQENILYRDERLLVVDKPHFLPVTPSGRFLRETLLVRLKKQFDLPHLSPLHRLDRETAGVILFSLESNSRGAYQSLFQARRVEKIYHAIAPHLTQIQFPLIKQSCLAQSSHFVLMEETQGPSNSETQISILENRGEYDLYELRPSTGKKHQLRLHLASLGAPILNDIFYPEILPCKGDDFSKPLQLLAKSIAFTDPYTGQNQIFQSQRRL